MQGVSSPIEKIKKQMDKMFYNKDPFMKTLQQVSTTQTDPTGKKTFRLKDEYMCMYDPFYYVSEKHNTM